jgi:ATP-dependent helicase IRC3
MVIGTIHCIIVRSTFIIQIGRGMRQSPGTGKENCRIIDFVDTTNRVAGVVSTPTLFGLDPSEVIDGTAVHTRCHIHAEG